MLFEEYLFKKIYRRRAKLHLGKHQQMAVFAHDYIGMEINYQGVYELEILQDITQFLKGRAIDLNGAFLDIGANIGNHAVFFSRFAKEIFAFEPNPKVFRLLQINTEGKAIKAFNLGLSDRNDRLRFVVDAMNLGGSHVADATESASSEIEVRRYDDIEELKGKRISLMKLDIEGHEPQAIRGASNMIQESRPVILFEQGLEHISDGSSPTIDVLRNLGYDFYIRSTNFDFRKGFRSVGRGLRSIFGRRLRFVLTTRFEKQSYDLIVALPREGSKALS